MKKSLILLLLVLFSLGCSKDSAQTPNKQANASSEKDGVTDPRKVKDTAGDPEKTPIKEPASKPTEIAPDSPPAVAKDDPKAARPQEPVKPQPQIIQDKTWTWEGSQDNYAKYSDLVFEVGMGGEKNGVGCADAAVEIENVRNVRLSVEASPIFKQHDDNSFAGFMVDYHTPDGYTKRVALSIGMYSEKRWTKTPIWGKSTVPDQFVDLGRKKEYTLDLNQWAPEGWDGKVWLTVSLQNSGRNTKLKADLSLAEVAKKDGPKPTNPAEKAAPVAKVEGNVPFTKTPLAYHPPFVRVADKDAVAFMRNMQQALGNRLPTGQAFEIHSLLSEHQGRFYYVDVIEDKVVVYTAWRLAITPADSSFARTVAQQMLNQALPTFLGVDSLPGLVPDGYVAWEVQSGYDKKQNIAIAIGTYPYVQPKDKMAFAPATLGGKSLKEAVLTKMKVLREKAKQAQTEELTADYLPFKEGTVRRYNIQVVRYESDDNVASGRGRLLRAKAIYKTDGLCENLIEYAGSAKGNERILADARATWEKQINQSTPFVDYYRQKNNQVEIGRKMTDDGKTAWELVLKIGAKDGEAWQWETDDVEARCTVLFGETHMGRPAAKVIEMKTIGKTIPTKTSVCHTYVKGVGEVERITITTTSAGQSIQGVAKLIEDDGEKIGAPEQIPFTDQLRADWTIGNGTFSAEGEWKYQQKRFAARIGERQKALASGVEKLDSAVTRVLATTSEKYVENGFKKYTFGSSMDDVKASTSFDADQGLRTFQADPLDPRVCRGENWLVNREKEEFYYFLDNKLLGFGKVYRDDLRGHAASMKELFGTTSKENVMSYAIVENRTSPDYSVSDRSDVGCVYYVFPKTVAGFSPVARSRKSRLLTQEPENKKPSMSSFVSSSESSLRPVLTRT